MSPAGEGRGHGLPEREKRALAAAHSARLAVMTLSPSPASAAGRRRAVGPLVVAAVSGVVHLVVGYFYLVSGLVAPLWAVLLLLVWWVVLAWLLLRLALRGSWWTPAVPLVAIVTWLAVLSVGGAFLDWAP